MVRLGEFTISRVEEIVLEEPVALFAEWSDDVLANQRDWLVPDYFDAQRGVFRSVIQGWVLRHGDRTVLIDTCSGNDKPRPASPRFDHLTTDFAARLRHAGVEAEAVDTVILTHLHVDHVGWNTRLDGDVWVPMFPRALHFMSGTELTARDPARGAASKPPDTWHVFNDSIAPVLAAGLASVVEGTETVMEGVDLVPIPGHAPGQMGVRVRSGGQEAFFTADVMHQPVQMYYPHWNSRYCEDPATARQTRLKVLAHAAAEGCLLLPAHFGKPYGGYVRAEADGYRFEPEPAVP